MEKVHLFSMPLAAPTLSRTGLSRIGAMAIAISALSAGQAHADSGPGDELFLKGREAMKVGNYKGACSLFESSHRVDPAPGTLLNIAVCSEKLGRLRNAGRALEDFLAAVEASDERRPRAVELLADVKQRTPEVRLRLRGPLPPGVQILVDGDDLGRDEWDAPVPLDPGRHVIEVRTPRRPDERRTVELEEADRHEETFVFVLAAQSAPPARALPPRSTDLPAAFYISFGVGVGGLVAAAGSGAYVLQQAEKVEDNCENKGERKECKPAGIEAGEKGRRFQTVGAIALPVGIAGMALAGYLWLRAKEDANPSVGIAVAPSHVMVSATGNY
jgi:hypothetical protein